MQVGNRCLATHSEVRDVQKNMLNPFAPGNFAKNDDFEAIRAVFWSPSGYNDPQLTKNAILLSWPSAAAAKYQLPKFPSMRRK